MPEQKIYKTPLEQAQADFNSGKISQGQLDDVAIADFEKKRKINNPQKPNYPGVVYPHNKQDFLKRHGLDKFYEFDGGDLVDLDDMSTTTVRVNDNGIQEDFLLDKIEGLGKWKRPVKRIDEKTALKPTPVEKSQFKKGQHNLKDEWNKQLDALEKSKPDKKGIIDKMRNYDDEAIELTRAFLSMMGGKW